MNILLPTSIAADLQRVVLLSCLLLLLNFVAVNPRETGMAFIINAIKKMWSLEEPEEPIPKYTFPDTMEGFGYFFNEQGELKDRGTGEGFKFRMQEDNHQYNQQRYDALGELVTEYLYEKMEKELNLERVYIPLDARKGDPQSFIFRSRNAMTTPDKLLVLIHGGGGVRAGQWSRKLIINENIEKGSQLPYIQRAMGDGYEVIVCNPNLNQVMINEKMQPVKGNKTPEEHGLYVWHNFIHPSKAQHVAIVAHSYGGIVTMHMIEKCLEEMKKRVFAVAFTDSVHTLQRHLWTAPAKAFIKERGVNFGASYVPENIQLQISDQDDCTSVSAGTQEHERTSYCAINMVFLFLHDNYATWSKNHTFAERHFLPLPEDLTPYMPATKWNLKMKQAEVTVVNEEEDAEEARSEGECQTVTKEEEESAAAAGGHHKVAVPMKKDEVPEQTEASPEPTAENGASAPVVPEQTEASPKPAAENGASAPVGEKPAVSAEGDTVSAESEAKSVEKPTEPAASKDTTTTPAEKEEDDDGARGDGKPTHDPKDTDTKDADLLDPKKVTAVETAEKESDANGIVADQAADTAPVGSHGDAAQEKTKSAKVAEPPEGIKDLKSEL